jgi:hypothetical protein
LVTTEASECLAVARKNAGCVTAGKGGADMLENRNKVDSDKGYGDLGRPDPVEHLAKAELASRMAEATVWLT